MNETRIALTGGVRVGKNTVADYLQEKYGMVPFAFGDKLKQEFHTKYPHIPRDPKPVRGYQLYGQLQRYVAGEDIWITKCFSEIERIRLAAYNYNHTGKEIPFRPLVTDLRQSNEFDRLRAEGYCIIRIESPIEKRVERMQKEGDVFNEDVFNFETETQLQNFDVDYVITNDDSLEALYEKVDKIMSWVTENKV